MTNSTTEAIAASCDYCGRENRDGVPACPACGKPLTTMAEVDSSPKRKSKGLAVCLALAFGPLGLLYADLIGGGVVMLVALPIYVLTHGGLWFSVGTRLLCAARAYSVVSSQYEASTPLGRSKRLLNEAARLENIDRSKAIVVYKQVARLFPDTPASEEAVRNIEALQRHQ